MDNDLLFSFRKHLEAHGRSPATVAAYTDHARLFLQSIAVEDIKAVTKGHIEAYIEGLHNHRAIDGKPYGLSTISVKTRSVKRLFEYLEAVNIVFINPAETIREPKKERGLPRNVPSPKEMERILDQPNLGLLSGIRDRAILEVLYTTGIRREELCRLTVFDADLAGGLLRVNDGKGRKDRVVPLGKHAIRFLREYITKVRPGLTRKNRKARELFINRYGGPISKQVLGIMIHTYARQAGIRASAHSFRHAFATVLVKNGADITAVQKMMGHADLTTTQQYIRSLGIDIKAEHRKTHPREKDDAAKESVKPGIERVKGRYERRTF